MNIMNSSFLCLDIGTSGVRGIAHHVHNATIDRSAYHCVDDGDIVFALKSVIDELEHQINAHFDSAYITGDFGPSYFNISTQTTTFPPEHRIGENDIYNQIAEIDAPSGFERLHLIPLRYDTPGFKNILSPIGIIDTELKSTFAGIYFNNDNINKILAILRRAHIMPSGFFTPHFVENAVLRQPKSHVMFIDFGARDTTVSIWTDRGPVWFHSFAVGGNDLTTQISHIFNIPFSDAERIKHRVANMRPNEMARFSPADPAYGFSCEDVNEIVIPFFNELITQIKSTAEKHIARYKPTQIFFGGGDGRTVSIGEHLADCFGMPTKNIGTDGAVRALSDYIWQTWEPYRQAYVNRTKKIDSLNNKIIGLFHIKKRTTRKRRTPELLPIYPSTLCFDMTRPETYELFHTMKIGAIHVDIMDGLYVDKIAGGIDQLRIIRKYWNGPLHVHLMTEAPTEWARDAIAAGADTIILSTNTSGVRNAVRMIRGAKRRVGIALNPDTQITILKTILRDLDEVMIMAVPPGAAGQAFNDSVLTKISALNATRKKYGLKYTISVDGGINADTAAKCWAAGADALVSGSYIANAPDFPLAVMSLLPHTSQV